MQPMAGSIMPADKKLNSRELVRLTMRGENPGRTPVYGWVGANLKDELTEAFGSVENFEDKYEFDMAHIFTKVSPYDYGSIDPKDEITPEMALEMTLGDLNDLDKYESVITQLKHHKERGRFCYIQTPGFFECMNGVFGIENSLLYLALYPEETKELYKRQAEWDIKFAENMIELGVDGIHISDDWGSQNALMFSVPMWRDMIFPYHKAVADAVKKYDVLLSLHSDGCVRPVLDGIVEIGYDFMHPWQENSNMPYSLYLDKYSDKFGILGGLCIQSALGFNDIGKVKSEIDRFFGLLKGKRWAFCTTHFVQDHCSIDELTAAYDYAVSLARK